jgi:hypothetical protein
MGSILSSFGVPNSMILEILQAAEKIMMSDVGALSAGVFLCGICSYYIVKTTSLTTSCGHTHSNGVIFRLKSLPLGILLTICVRFQYQDLNYLWCEAIEEILELNTRRHREESGHAERGHVAVYSFSLRQEAAEVVPVEAGHPGGGHSGDPKQAKGVKTRHAHLFGRPHHPDGTLPSTTDGLICEVVVEYKNATEKVFRTTHPASRSVAPSSKRMTWT